MGTKRKLVIVETIAHNERDLAEVLESVQVVYVTREGRYRTKDGDDDRRSTNVEENKGEGDDRRSTNVEENKGEGEESYPSRNGTETG